MDLSTTCKKLQMKQQSGDQKATEFGVCGNGLVQFSWPRRVADTGLLNQSFGSTLLSVNRVGRTPRGSCNRTLLRRVLRRFFKGSAS